MKRDKEIERLREELAEMTSFNAAAREMHAKSENELGFMTARCQALEVAVVTLSRLLAEGRAECAKKHLKWSRS